MNLFEGNQTMKNSDTVKVLKLHRPIMLGDTIIDELEIREPVAGDLRGVNLTGGNMQTDDILKLIRNCANQPDSVVNKLSIGDFTAAGEIIGNFIENSRKIGDK